VAESQHTVLRAGQKLLDHHAVAGSTELFVQHDLLDGGVGLGLVLADQHALAQRQAVRLDDHRVLAAGADVVHHLGRVLKHLVVGGGDAVLFHQVFAEHLAGLDAGGRLVGAESGGARRGARGQHAQRQRVTLGDDHVGEGFLLGKGHHGLHIGGGDGLAGGVVADAAVAGGTPDLGAVRAFFQRADDGVFTPAAANNKDLHAK